MKFSFLHKITPETDNSSRKLLSLTYILGMLFFLVFSHIYDPLEIHSIMPCPVYFLTGYYCPGCGTLRSFHALLNGHLIDALRFNALTVVLAPFLFVGLVSRIVYFQTGKPLVKIKPYPLVGWFLLAVIIVYWIARNIPVFPFSWLAPG